MAEIADELERFARGSDVSPVRCQDVLQFGPGESAVALLLFLMALKYKKNFMQGAVFAEVSRGIDILL